MEYYQNCMNSIVDQAEACRSKWFALKEKLKRANEKIEQLETKLARTTEQKNTLLSRLGKLCEELADPPNTCTSETSKQLGETSVSHAENLKIHFSTCDVTTALNTADSRANQYGDKVFDNSSLSGTLDETIRNAVFVPCTNEILTYISSLPLAQQVNVEPENIPDTSNQDQKHVVFDSQPSIHLSDLQLVSLKDTENIPAMAETSNQDQQINNDTENPETSNQDQQFNNDTENIPETSNQNQKDVVFDSQPSTDLSDPQSISFKDIDTGRGQSIANNNEHTDPDVENEKKYCMRIPSSISQQQAEVQTDSKDVDGSNCSVTQIQSDEKSSLHCQKKQTTPKINVRGSALTKDLWECSICDRRFNRPEILAKHIKKIHGTARSTVRCAARGFISQTIKSLLSIKHSKKMRNNKIKPTPFVNVAQIINLEKNLESSSITHANNHTDPDRNPENNEVKMQTDEILAKEIKNNVELIDSRSSEHDRNDMTMENSNPPKISHDDIDIDLMCYDYEVDEDATTETISLHQHHSLLGVNNEASICMEEENADGSTRLDVNEQSCKIDDLVNIIIAEDEPKKKKSSVRFHNLKTKQLEKQSLDNDSADIKTLKKKLKVKKTLRGDSKKKLKKCAGTSKVKQSKNNPRMKLRRKSSRYDFRK